MYLSATRARIFNQVLSRRVAEDTWNQALTGDVMMLDGSHSVFAPATVDETIRQRVAAADIHPTGPLWGTGKLLSQGAVLAMEQAVAGDFPILCRGLEQAGLKQERRALRVRVKDFAWEWQNEDALVISFRLPAGAYATAVLQELVVLR